MRTDDRRWLEAALVQLEPHECHFAMQAGWVLCSRGTARDYAALERLLAIPLEDDDGFTHELLRKMAGMMRKRLGEAAFMPRLRLVPARSE